MTTMHSEKQLQDYTKKVAIAHHCGFYKMECVGQTGFPDVMLTFGGYCIFIELKAPSGKGRVSVRQKYMASKLTYHGIENYVANSTRQIDLIISRLINRESRPLPIAII
jgi:hypothetical protein|tara:strand:- start:2940 stop:3266 length:327 start_codon:yes stop_codon:yes gene_type:complete